MSAARKAVVLLSGGLDSTTVLAIAKKAEFEALHFRTFFLQPMDGLHRERNTREAVRYCLAHPKWRLSIQTQKVLGIA